MYPIVKKVKLSNVLAPYPIIGDLMADIITHTVVQSKSLVDQPLADAEEVLGDLGPTVHALLYLNESGLANEELAQKGRRFVSHSEFFQQQKRIEKSTKTIMLFSPNIRNLRTAKVSGSVKAREVVTQEKKNFQSFIFNQLTHIRSQIIRLSNQSICTTMYFTIIITITILPVKSKKK